MRKALVLIAAFSLQAWACPDLTGNFTCTYQNGSSEIISISQAEKAGVTVYNYNGSEIPADNVVYNLPDDETLKESTFRAWCEGASLKGNIVGKYYNQGSYFGDLDMVLDLSLAGSDLHSVTTGTLKSASGDYPLDGEVTCVRQ
ncbi:MAG: hypothetical protein AB7F86_18840 [Bdellovibrionales bacterium]